MKRSYYLPELNGTTDVDKLIDGLERYFKWGLQLSYDKRTTTLNFELSEMGRNLYPDESSEAEPHRLGQAVSVDSIRLDKISAYVNGFIQALTTLDNHPIIL